ncbi:MAG: hypothetical protein A2V64_04490 [Bacteroidetes bacterium RBG_13_43_22]|nr:MAG: hypothetical protein A2V64_04490 [Bacteroidetes bacterium RBG_13_43_22]
METFGIYLLKSILWLTGFALVYLLFLRSERFFQLKRAYLLTGILVSVIFPVISIHYQVEVPAPAVPEINVADYTITSNAAIPVAVQGKPFNYSFILLSLYVSGILFLGYRIIQHILLIQKALNKATINSIGSARLIRISSFPASFSFFNYVFINPSVDEAEVREIMNHELVHVNQKHWLDLLLIEMLRLFQWVNPFVWIYTGFIRLNNEYLADSLALQRSENPSNYKAALMNQLFRSPVISLSNSFNYSLNKKRFDMMKKIITSPYRKLKVLLVLPVFAIVLYAFATPEYHYLPSDESTLKPLIIYETLPIVQKEVKGIILNKEGKPLMGVYVTSTGTSGNAHMSETGSDGKFTFDYVQPDASLLFFCRGYKQLTLKPDFNSEMKVIMEVDPEYKAPPVTSTYTPGIPAPPRELVVVDGVISENSFYEVMKELGYNMGPVKSLFGKNATDKYGDKGINGVREITTRKKAIEMEQKVPLPKLAPSDFPTFRGQRFTSFTDWVQSQAKYPEEAKAKNIDGWVSVNYTVELDGTISNIKSTLGDPLLAEELIRVIKSSPRWDPPQNPEVDSPHNSTATLRFKLPDQVLRIEPFVVVEQMPRYPGGDVALLDFIKNNTKYPEEAKSQKIEGRVIIRFIVNSEGYVEGVSALKGVHPLLDAEAIRVISSLLKFEPGIQGGNPVDVWYMAPVSFSLPQTDTPQ